MKKKFKLSGQEIKQLIPDMGGCVVSDKVSVNGMKIMQMYREKPDRDDDSGWTFFSGTESEKYMENAKNFEVFEVNTVANMDPTIIPFLNAEYGTEYYWDEDTNSFEFFPEEEE